MAIRASDSAISVLDKFRTVKKVLVASDTPRTENRVAVKYTGWVLATQPVSSGQAPKITDSLIRKTKATNAFDSTRKLTLTLGAKSAFPGWDPALETMNIGEKALFIFAPEHAFGDKGVALTSIPPNAWLMFEVELFEAPPALKINWFEVAKTVAVVSFVLGYLFWYNPVITKVEQEEEL